MTEEQKEELCKIGEDEFQHLSESYYKLHEKYYKLQQENKELQAKVEQLEEELEKADSITQSCIFLGKEESTMNFRTLLNELEKTKKEKKQLETNRDEAIKKIKKRSTPEVAQLYIEILKGSENNE